MRLVPIGIGESFGEAKLVRATHARLLWRHDHVDPRAVADYITGFSKIIENGFRKTFRAVESGLVEKLNPVEIHVEGLLRELNPDDNARAGAIDRRTGKQGTQGREEKKLPQQKGSLFDHLVCMRSA